MVDACREYHIFLRVHTIATLQHLVDAVTIYISYTKLVEFGRPRLLVVSAPSIIMVKIGWLAVHPVETEGEYIVVMAWSRRLILLSVETLHEERRVDSVIVGYGEVATHLIVALVVHIERTVVAGIGIHAVGHLLVFQFGAVFLGTRQSINHGYIEWRISGGVVVGSIIHDAVAIHISLVAVHGIESPGFLLLVPEAGSIRTLDQHLAFAVTIYIINGDHIVLTGVDIHVRPHIHRPEASAISRIGLEHVLGGLGCTRKFRRGISILVILFFARRTLSAVESIYNVGINLAIAVHICRPYILTFIIIGIEQFGLEVDVHEHVGIAVLLEEPWNTLLALLAINYGGHGNLSIIRKSRGSNQVIGLGYRLIGEPGIITRTRCTGIDVILNAIALLSQFSPGDQHIAGTLNGHNASSQLLLQALGLQLLHRHQACHQQSSIKESFFHCFLYYSVSRFYYLNRFFSYPFSTKEQLNNSLKKKSSRIASQTLRFYLQPLP